MDKSDKSNSEFAKQKRKLLYWLSTLKENEEQVQNINIDVPELSVLLQIMGYNFECFEKIPNIKNESSIELTCGISGTKNKFKKELFNCRCPTNDEMEQAQVWSVTGFGSQNSVHSSTNSLIPTIGKGKVQLISYLMAKIFKIINDKDSEEKEVLTLSQNALLVRYRSLDTLKDNSSSFKENLKRELSWEVDPPTTTSSPVPNLTQTLSRISLDLDIHDHIRDIEEFKKLADEKLEKLKAISKSKSKKRFSDIKPVEQSLIDSNATPVTPRKKVVPKRYITSSGKKTGILTPTLKNTPISGLSARVPIGSDPVKPKPNVLKKNLISKRNETIFKSKIGTSSKIKSTIGLKTVSTPTQPGASGIARYTKKI
ncbi:hypothetical protein FQR65_LT05392 [Abscondita terminalis]|nr:hypothetical protein FQR65_LT05392 [Abscondita terminalis]